MIRVHPAQTHSSALLSIIIPFCNEREMLPLLLERLHPVAAQLAMNCELVFVDDGSTDGSAEFLLERVHQDERVRLVRLSRNFGKEAALTAGIDHADGNAVVIIDADLQDPPELIPTMVEHWRDGVDVVLMQRRSREGEGWFKRFSAYMFYRFLSRVCRQSIPVDTGDFRLMSRRAVSALRRLGERNRYMKGLFAWVGMPTVVLPYDRDPRAAGTTKWNYFGLLSLALEGVTSFSTAPLRWATGAGVIAATLGALFGVWIVAKAALFGETTSGYPSLVAIITFLGGIQLLAIGIVGEYVGKTYMESKQRPVYLEQEVVESTPEPQRASQPTQERREYAQLG
ncbi:glycosyltransferase family 2 protein [Halospina sp. K52047b]|uniref:glycosyltransferase family 2 protein n=1 Tax=Halospina sp. K52047b TaxID=2614160 RepID=UPI00124A7749|nr:glycosyltransferase family 2 protein [Halospina sp. K52047b]KAA8980353.1 glycosyltransferase family 2 protein [Halospina sp. K52047b]